MSIARIFEIYSKLSIFPFLLFLPPRIAAREARILLESLGCVFVKFGQLLSYHPLPREVREELEKLMYKITPFPERDAEKIVRSSFGEELRLRRIATASISQVHLDQYGRVVKVRKPGIVEEVERDLRILNAIKDFLPSTLLRETVRMLVKSLPEEVNFRSEAKNIEDMGFLELKIPEVYGTSEDVIIMERLQGRSLAEGGVEGEKKRIVFTKLLKALADSVREGIIHGDPSPANIIVGEDVGLVDFGLVWRAKKRRKWLNFTMLS